MNLRGSIFDKQRLDIVKDIAQLKEFKSIEKK